MGIKVGVCGAGAFGRCFIPLFKAHPLVDEVVLAEAIPERLAEEAARFEIRRTFASLEALCASDVDAVAILTQRHLHGPQAVHALNAGKHVYSAVPTGITVDEVGELVQTVARTGLTYMLGETSYYYPSTLYCRQRFADGAFGRFVYGEAAYYHDMSHGFYQAFQHSGGEKWKQVAGFPPMYYPTHSVSMILSVTGARITDVSCFGFVDQHEDGVFTPEGNLWGNVFSNETALMRTSDGGSCRINEFRRVGWSGGNSVHLSLYGTEGCYEEQANAQVWVTKRAGEMTDLRDALRCQDIPVPKESGDLHEALQADFHRGVSSVHPVGRLPREFAGLGNGHYGSHQFLVDDFLTACVTGKRPPNHVWMAARYALPGITAHESAKRGGEMLPVPDFGDPPA